MSPPPLAAGAGERSGSGGRGAAEATGFGVGAVANYLPIFPAGDISLPNDL